VATALSLHLRARSLAAEIWISCSTVPGNEASPYKRPKPAIDADAAPLPSCKA
jgi:hypothetical protein